MFYCKGGKSSPWAGKERAPRVAPENNRAVGYAMLAEAAPVGLGQCGHGPLCCLELCACEDLRATEEWPALLYFSLEGNAHTQALSMHNPGQLQQCSLHLMGNKPRLLLTAGAGQPGRWSHLMSWADQPLVPVVGDLKWVEVVASLEKNGQLPILHPVWGHLQLVLSGNGMLRALLTAPDRGGCCPLQSKKTSPCNLPLWQLAALGRQQLPVLLPVSPWCKADGKVDGRASLTLPFAPSISWPPSTLPTIPFIWDPGWLQGWSEVRTSNYPLHNQPPIGSSPEQPKVILKQTHLQTPQLPPLSFFFNFQFFLSQHWCGVYSG